MGKGLYVHIPFCIQKCRYCDFISFCRSEKYFDEYIKMLLVESEEYKNEIIDSIFIGGGTPTVFSAIQLSRLLQGLKTTFNITDDAEFTIESNPKTLDNEKLDVLKNAGVNRISIGVQSFCDEELTAIGRIHSSSDAIKTAEMINKTKSFNLNVDLMLALPRQTEKSLMNTLKTAISLNPSHLSCYSLIIEEGTPLYDDYKSGRFEYPDDDFDRKMYRMTVDYLHEHGYNRYEISNFSKKGHECRHNLKYWNCDEYIGIGVAAHSYIGNIRSFNTSDLTQYLKGSFHEADKTILSDSDKISEYIIMRLRLSEGVSENEFYKRFNKRFPNMFTGQINKLIGAGLMEKSNGFYRLTDYGIDLSNTAMCEFV